MISEQDTNRILDVVSKMRKEEWFPMDLDTELNQAVQVLE
jgi:hypothetical protein